MKTAIELVRHAKSHSRDKWWGRPDRERPLTDAGMQQARQLAVDLAERGDVVALYSSPWVRCTQTIEPLADALDQPIIDADRLGEVVSLPVHDGGDAWVTSAWLGGRAVSFLNEIVGRHAGHRVVACSHGDVIPAAMAALIGRDALELSDVRCKKGARFTLTFDGGRCLDAVYHPPPR